MTEPATLCMMLFETQYTRTDRLGNVSCARQEFAGRMELFSLDASQIGRFQQAHNFVCGAGK